MKSTFLPYLGLFACCALCACPGGDGPRSGFEPPDVATTAYDAEGAQVPADWSCLGTPAEEVATSVEVSLTGVVYELASAEPAADIEVGAFSGLDWDTLFDSDVSDAHGGYALTVPAGTQHLGFLVTGVERLTGFRLEVPLDPDLAEQEVDLDTISLTDAASVAASVGVTRSPGRGLVLGGIRDCADHDIAGVIATVSTAAGEPAHADGVSTYYFDETLHPQVPSVQPYTGSYGLFLVVELPPSTAPHWLQVWGFVDEQSLQADDLALLAEARIPMVADSSVSIGLEPLRTQGD